MSEKEILDVTAEVAKEIAKDVYEDAGKPIAKPTGELVGLIPRAIKAALSPLEKWILQREYNVEETRKLLEKKLESTPPNQIEAPEPHIAVPAMQYISYCMDNEELREMYANLLASSMKKDTKDNVHPSFVEIIKQLSPDEARLLKYIFFYSNVHTIPVIYFKIHKKDGSVVILEFLATTSPEFACCERRGYGAYHPYFENLERLGLIRCSKEQSLKKMDKYSQIKKSEVYNEIRTHFEGLGMVVSIEDIYGTIQVTSFGNDFCAICL